VPSLDLQPQGRRFLRDHEVGPADCPFGRSRITRCGPQLIGRVWARLLVWFYIRSIGERKVKGSERILLLDSRRFPRLQTGIERGNGGCAEIWGVITPPHVFGFRQCGSHSTSTASAWFGRLDHCMSVCKSWTAKYCAPSAALESATEPCNVKVPGALLAVPSTGPPVLAHHTACLPANSFPRVRAGLARQRLVSVGCWSGKGPVGNS
jgi:hypothetical protein